MGQIPSRSKCARCSRCGPVAEQRTRESFLSSSRVRRGLNASSDADEVPAVDTAHARLPARRRRTSQRVVPQDIGQGRATAAQEARGGRQHMLAGVRCMNAPSTLRLLPDFDATVVSASRGWRVSARRTVSTSASGRSHTNATTRQHPHRMGYSRRVLIGSASSSPSEPTWQGRDRAAPFLPPLLGIADEADVGLVRTRLMPIGSLRHHTGR